jgi:hypothetical protein
MQAANAGAIEAAEPAERRESAKAPAAAPEPVTSCWGDRRRPTDATPRTRVRKGAPAVTEQLCLAV